MNEEKAIVSMMMVGALGLVIQGLLEPSPEPDPDVPEPGPDPAVEPAVEILRTYLRAEIPTVSAGYSGWVSVSLGSELSLGSLRKNINAGVTLRNITDYPLVYIPTMYNYHWTEPNNYVTDYLTIASVEPAIISPAPTGLPYSNNEYECDKFLAPGDSLKPGEIGFIYAELFPQSRRWNNVSVNIMCNGVNLGAVLMYSGWYSY